MIFSLARFHHSRPPLPCWLGGVLWHHEKATYLHTADAPLVAIQGPLGDLRQGDHIRVHVLSATSDRIVYDQAELLLRPKEPSVVTPRGANAIQFTRFVRTLVDFFVNSGFKEIFTPSLVTCPGLEPSLEPFALSVRRGREQVQAYLPTSPEIHLKKALTCGFTDIFAIKECFRAGEFSPQHENEFLMLEWYRGYADLGLILSDLEHLLRHFRPEIKLASTTWAKLFREELAFHLQPTTSRAELAELCTRMDIHFRAEDSFNDLFHRLVIDKIEPMFAARGPLVVRDFPPSQAALARLTAEGWADRFEFYWQGLEIANAFNEVSDPDEQLARWQAELREREHLGTGALPLDEGLLWAMRRQGLPPTGGIALGLERLFMALYGVTDIRQLRFFATEDLFRRQPTSDE